MMTTKHLMLLQSRTQALSFSSLVVADRYPDRTCSRVTQKLGEKKFLCAGGVGEWFYCFCGKSGAFHWSRSSGKLKTILLLGSCKSHMLLNTATLFLTFPKNRILVSFTKKFSSRMDHKCTNFLTGEVSTCKTLTFGTGAGSNWDRWKVSEICGFRGNFPLCCMLCITVLSHGRLAA